LVGKIVLVVDGLYRTDRFAGTAIYTLIRVNVEHAITFINAIDGAFIYAGFVLEVNAR
jgi:hypothetical protein